MPPPRSCARTRGWLPKPAPRCWCWNACLRRWPPRSLPPARSRPSASVQARIATARCWCCTTCSAWTPGTADRSSSRISSPKADRLRARCVRSPMRCATAVFPMPGTVTPDWINVLNQRDSIDLTQTSRPMIETIAELAALRARIGEWKRAGLRVGFVPTMGNLHAGHHSLVRLAREHADRVVASVFVNPTQFGPNEDFSRYPRTPDQDAQGLAAAGCDALWMPPLATMYPYGAERAVTIRVPGVTEVLEGAHRPGHFDGVATVVARLFNQVQPDVAVFGRKDYQQLAVIRYLVADLAFPLELIAAETRREPDGLAMSSRNQYLSPEERAIAPVIHRTLLAMRDGIRAGRSRAQLEADASAALRQAGLDPDYAVIRKPDLSEPATGDSSFVALVAARLGRTRLIDNLEFDA